MPSSRQAEMMRRAISPRLATRIFLNIVSREPLAVSRGGCLLRLTAYALTAHDPHHTSGGEPYREELLPVLDRLAIQGKDLDDLSFDIRLDLVHELHGLDDAEDLAPGDFLPHFGKGIGLGRGSTVESPHDRRGDDVQTLLLFRGGQRRGGRARRPCRKGRRRREGLCRRRAPFAGPWRPGRARTARDRGLPLSRKQCAGYPERRPCHRPPGAARCQRSCITLNQRFKAWIRAFRRAASASCAVEEESGGRPCGAPASPVAPIRVKASLTRRAISPSEGFDRAISW